MNSLRQTLHSSQIAMTLAAVFFVLVFVTLRQNFMACLVAASIVTTTAIVSVISIAIAALHTYRRSKD